MIKARFKTFILFVGLSAASVAAAHGIPISCSEQRFNAFNSSFSIDKNLTEHRIGKSEHLSISENSTLLFCGNNATFVSNRFRKCVSEGDAFEREWSKPRELTRGVDYLSAKYLYACHSVLIEWKE